MKTLLALCLGASLGATARWLLGLGLNALFPLIPCGTLLANLLGGFCIGLAASFVATFPHVDPLWRIFIITGFLGALTTFSTFSLEVVSLLQQQRLLLAMTAVALHVCGSLVMTFCGMAAFSALRTLCK